MRYHRILTAILQTAWAIEPVRGRRLFNLIVERAAATERLSDAEIAARIEAAAPAAADRPRRTAPGSVAVLPLRGVISHRASMIEDVSTGAGTSVERFTARLRAAVADKDVKAIVIDVDSPGGSVAGVNELAREIFDARAHKHIVAVANSLAASAAYWIASAADELVVIPSGEVGSIGVFAAHEDLSEAMAQAGVKVTFISAGKFKTEGNAFEPLSEEAQAAIQKRVDEYYDDFVKAVARHRAVTPADVRNGFGQGRVVGASEALLENMVDRVATLDYVIDRLGAAAPAQEGGAAGLAPAVVHEQRRREYDIRGELDF